MPNIEFLARAKSFSSRRHRHPDQLQIVIANHTRCTSELTQRSNDQRREHPESPGLIATSRQESSPPTKQYSSSGAYNDVPVSFDSPMIGLAIGSPHESPLSASTSGKSNGRQECCQSPEAISTVQSGSNTSCYTSSGLPDAGKVKGTPWKSIGGLFGKKNILATPTASPSYQTGQLSPNEDPRLSNSVTVQSGQAMDADGLLDPEFSVGKKKESRPHHSPIAMSDIHKAESPRRKRSIRRFIAEKQMEPSSKHAVPRLRSVPTGKEIGQKSPKPPPKDNDFSGDPATFKLKGGSLLEVEIPSVQMERYSIMFGGLLHPQNDLIETYDPPLPGKPRSKSPAKSTAVSLSSSVATSNRRSPGHKHTLERSPLHRSASTTDLTSPNRTKLTQGFGASPNSENDNVIFIVRNPDKDLRVFGTSERPMFVSNTVRSSQTSTEAGFYSASETQPLQTTPEPTVSKQGFPTRTSSIRGQPLGPTNDRTQRSDPSAILASTSKSSSMIPRLEIGHYLDDRAFPDLMPLALNPPTPRSTQHGSSQTRKKRSRKHGHPPDTRKDNTDVPVSALRTVFDSNESTPGLAVKIQSQPTSTSSPGIHVVGTPQRNHKNKAATQVQSAAKVKSPIAQPFIETLRQTSRRPTPPPHQESSLDPLQLPSLHSAGSKSAEDLKNAAEVSIARQISISHRQRELLVPIAPNLAKQPTLVDVCDHMEMARKSQHLVLENA